MAVRLTGALRVLVAVAVAAAFLVLAEPAVAVTVPQTLADRRPVQAGPVEPGFPIDHLGVIWDTPHDDDHTHEEAVGSHGAVRFRVDGSWGPWIPLVTDGAEAEGSWASGLVPGGDADAYQVRGIPADARSARVVAINTTDGPEVQVGERPADAAGALANTMCRSRADWGADESLRYTKRGRNVTETWPPEFYPVQTLTVHHTATANGDTDPESTVRAIYRYHAIDRGWGDIGYQYLVDEAGVVYEGRWSGTESRSCELDGGDGSDFGHETDSDSDLDGDGSLDEMVTGAHVGGWNSGNMGVALLGEFTYDTGVPPQEAAVDSLEAVLTELSTRHGLDPEGTVDYVNPVNGSTKTVATISGHKDWEATACPGDHLYVQLPTIRTNVAAAMGGGDDGGDDPIDEAPTVSIQSPADQSTVSGTIDVQGSASDDDGVVSVDVFVDSTQIGTASASPWSISWDTTGVADGWRTVTATVTDTAGQQASASVDVLVDNVADPVELTVTSTDRDGSNPLGVGSGQPMVVSGTGFADVSAVSFESGRGHSPTVTSLTVDSSGQLTATVTVEAKGPGGSWDVRVTLADGRSAACASCAEVRR